MDTGLPCQILDLPRGNCPELTHSTFDAHVAAFSARQLGHRNDRDHSNLTEIILTGNAQHTFGRAVANTHKHHPSPAGIPSRIWEGPRPSVAWPNKSARLASIPFTSLPASRSDSA